MEGVRLSRIYKNCNCTTGQVHVALLRLFQAVMVKCPKDYLNIGNLELYSKKGIPISFDDIYHEKNASESWAGSTF